MPIVCAKSPFKDGFDIFPVGDAHASKRLNKSLVFSISLRSNSKNTEMSALPVLVRAL
jgi:hypothetical protein